MINNDVLRRLRYTFNYNDTQMIKIFALADEKVSREQICAWLKSEEDPTMKKCQDQVLANFLNGMIIKHRGKKDGEPPRKETRLTNNSILTKLKIAFNLKTEDMLAILDLANFKVSKHELSALFRKATHRHHRECKDQFLRNFLKGLQLKYRKVEEK
ncbi:UNVERIFIED_CONTAM: hypothetical protein GTU68_065438 [Idotea baltica]|nr:hypothetical protein [Idotea baltica]